MAEFEASNSLPDLGEDIDNETFGQIYDMDEDEDHSFSLQIVEEFFEQAYDTFKEMDELLEKEDLITLSERGHYLKGSSATLGLVKVKDCCEQIQRYGKMEDLDGTPVEDKAECRKRLKQSMGRVKIDCNRAERILKGFYHLPVPDELDEEAEEDEAKEATAEKDKKATETEQENDKKKEEDTPKEDVGKPTAESKTEAKKDERDDKAKKTEV
ncbi:hpt domain-containing protein [Zalerion maritima]|uniref:Hpt domain-containing protein n=1 Tax=Zalerion maritima TaxID=339359 RepID=A0AAD5WU39_9PEZI|nr:hpt domain-containing protein [Zalerion maritima]